MNLISLKSIAFITNSMAEIWQLQMELREMLLNRINMRLHHASWSKKPRRITLAHFKIRITNQRIIHSIQTKRNIAAFLIQQLLKLPITRIILGSYPICKLATAQTICAKISSIIMIMPIRWVSKMLQIHWFNKTDITIII